MYETDAKVQIDHKGKGLCVAAIPLVILPLLVLDAGPLGLLDPSGIHGHFRARNATVRDIIPRLSVYSYLSIVTE